MVGTRYVVRETSPKRKTNESVVFKRIEKTLIKKKLVIGYIRIFFSPKELNPLIPCGNMVSKVTNVIPPISHGFTTLQVKSVFSFVHHLL
jgi:hypothetical protein